MIERPKIWTCLTIFEPMKSHIYEPNLSLISLIRLMFNYPNPELKQKSTSLFVNVWDQGWILDFS